MADETRIFDDETFNLVQQFYDENGHLQHQIGAFNVFIHHTIAKIFNVFGKNVFCLPKNPTKRYILEFSNHILDTPKYPPTMCLMLNCTYMSNLYVDIKITPPTGEPIFRQRTPFGQIPVMVYSDLCILSKFKGDHRELAARQECIYDTGGYFVAKVVSKDKSSKGGIAHRMIVAPQERATPNRICVFRNRKSNPQYSIYAEVRSTSSNGYQSVFMVGYLNNIVTCILPRFLVKIPIGIVFGALGMTDFKDILSTISCNTLFEEEVVLILQRTLENSYEYSTQDLCLEYIGRLGMETMKKRTEKKKKKKYDLDDEETVVVQEEEIEDNLVNTFNAVENEMTENKYEKKVERERLIAIKFANEYLKRELFSHLHGGYEGENVDIQTTFSLKTKFLGLVLNELFLVIQSDIDDAKGANKPRIYSSDRDHLAFKRTMDINVLLEQQFRGAMIKLIQEVRGVALKALKEDIGADIYSAIKPTIITNAMIGAVSCSNTWYRGTAKGVSQIFDQFNFMGGEANKRKTKVPMAAEGTKMTAPHDLHASQYGVICPSETPDGEDTGLTKNLALMAVLTIGSDIGENLGILAMINDFPSFAPPDRLIEKGERWVLMNGDLIGIAKNPDEFVKKFREARRCGEISRQVGVNMSLNRDIIRINTDQGRLMYPTLIVGDDGELKITAEIIEQIATRSLNSNGEVWTWERLCSEGYIEFIDKDEEDNILLASYPSQVYEKADSIVKTLKSVIGESKITVDDLVKYRSSLENLPTHCEIHPSMMYGIGASLIPFPDHNQSPRNCYQANMGKQFVGIPFSNYRNFVCSKFHCMEYVQRPLTLSRGGNMVGYNNLPTGQNAMIVIMPGPFNEEDSIMMSKSSIDNGFMTSYLCTPYFAECQSHETFMKPSNPDPTKGCFDKLAEKTEDYVRADGVRVKTFAGIVPRGTRLKHGDVMVCKAKTSFDSGVQHEIFVTVYKDIFDAVIDKVIVGKTSEGFDCVRIMTMQRREPIIGDKFAARHSQKGTVGMILPQVDLPFGTDGRTPDIVVNALAFPSRMTIAMLIEQMTGRIAITQKPSPLKIATAQDLNDVLNKKVVDLTDSVEYDMMFNGLKAVGTEVDATAFRRFSLDVLRTELKKCGIPNLCSDRMYNGETGEMFDALIFRGPVYYGRMKHMVQDKMHARQRGGKSSITQQPLEGRRCGGGMRNGVQERDNFLGAGAPNIAKDRLFTQSDDYAMWVCDICGCQANVKIVNGQLVEKRCNICSANQVSKVAIPYGTKLVMQELAGMGIFARIMTNPQ
jgi:DNA-directed RNA polymerase II subunit RPB2